MRLVTKHSNANDRRANFFPIVHGMKLARCKLRFKIDIDLSLVNGMDEAEETKRANADDTRLKLDYLPLSGQFTEADEIASIICGDR